MTVAQEHKRNDRAQEQMLFSAKNNQRRRVRKELPGYSDIVCDILTINAGTDIISKFNINLAIR